MDGKPAHVQVFGGHHQVLAEGRLVEHEVRSAPPPVPPGGGGEPSAPPVAPDGVSQEDPGRAVPDGARMAALASFTSNVVPVHAVEVGLGPVGHLGGALPRPPPGCRRLPPGSPPAPQAGSITRSSHSTPARSVARPNGRGWGVKNWPSAERKRLSRGAPGRPPPRPRSPLPGGGAPPRPPPPGGGSGPRARGRVSSRGDRGGGGGGRGPGGLP